MEIIAQDSVGLLTKASIVTRYKMWKQNLHKWDQYIKNKNTLNKSIDQWSLTILREITGHCLVYNSGGLFFKDFDTAITVLEQKKCPVLVSGMLYADEMDVEVFNNSIDDLVLVNPISLKYHSCITTFLTVPGISRAGYKPNLLAWVKKNGKIFLSFSDYHMSYNRLKFIKEEFILKELGKLESVGLECIYKDIQSSNTDLVNGNIKLIFKRH
jgi:hypothetical protein